jgi:hypothetical protein
VTPSERGLLVKLLVTAARHLHALAMCGITEDFAKDDDQRRVHYIAVRALQEASTILEVAADKIENGRPA